MIGERLKPFSTDLLHVVEMAGQIVSKLAKDASSSEATTKSSSLTPKGTTHPLGASKTRTKQTTCNKYGDLPILAKQLI